MLYIYIYLVSYLLELTSVFCSCILVGSTLFWCILYKKRLFLCNKGSAQHLDMRVRYRCSWAISPKRLWDWIYIWRILWERLWMKHVWCSFSVWFKTSWNQRLYDIYACGFVFCGVVWALITSTGHNYVLVVPCVTSPAAVLTLWILVSF